MNNPAYLDQQAKALVDRANAGDQNAMALILMVGKAARTGINQRARAAFLAIKSAIGRTPEKEFRLAPYKPTYKRIKTPPRPAAIIGAELILASQNGEGRKPPMPPGTLNGIYSPSGVVGAIVKACKYSHGMSTAAYVLSKGPVLSTEYIQQIGVSCFGSDVMSRTFFYGVKNTGEAAFKEIAPHVDEPTRRCLLVGQTIGKALRLQALSDPQCPISKYDPVVGWELGE